MNEHEFNTTLQVLPITEDNVYIVHYEIGTLPVVEARERILNFINDIGEKFPSLKGRLMICPMRLGKKTVEFEAITKTDINKLVVYSRTYNMSKDILDEYFEGIKQGIESTHNDLKGKVIVLPKTTTVEIDDAEI